MGKPEGIRIFLRIRPLAKQLQPSLNGNVSRNNCSNSNSGDVAMRPFTVEHTFDNSTVHFHLDRRADTDVINNTKEDYRFTFRRAFEPSATQEEVFNVVAKDCVMAVLDGYNSTIFAYGQTGSGKTHSITGGAESYDDRGIIPRAIALIYDEVARRQRECTWSIAVSYLQIYNDKGQDLLNHGRDARRLEDLPVVTIHDGDEDEMVLRGLAQHGAPNAQEALNLLFLGDTNRLYCETPMNKTSSRSHCVFTVYLEARAHGSSVVRRSKLNLVDLAGSERVAKTGVSGTVLTEAKHINLSLHYLEQVIMALSEQANGKREHVPFRNSFMTMVLRDSLGGNCRTSMLATAHPAHDHLPETISTCRFAQRVALIRQDAHVNEEVDPHVLVSKLKAELQQLRDQLAFYNKDGGGAPDRELTDDEKQRCNEMVRQFVEDTSIDARIGGFDGDLARIYYCFDVMKRMLPDSGGVSGGRGIAGDSGVQKQLNHPSLEVYRARIDALEMSLKQKENEMNMLFGVLQKAQRTRFNAETQTGLLTDVSHSNGNSRMVITSSDYIGENMSTPVQETMLLSSSLLHNNRRQEEQQGSERSDHSATVSSFTARGLHFNNPSTTTVSRGMLHERLDPAQAAAVDEFFRKQEQLNEVYDLSALTDADLLKDRATAFEAFHRSYRNCAQTEKNKLELKGRYETCKITARQLNDTVDRIKQLKTHIQRLRAERALQGVEEVDEAERTALEELTTQKTNYNDLATSLRRQKEEIDAMHLFMKRAQEQLTKDFEDWLQIRQKQLSMATNEGVNNNSTENGISKRSTALTTTLTTTTTSSASSPTLQRIMTPFQNLLPLPLPQKREEQQQQQQEHTPQRFLKTTSVATAELPPLREEKMASSRSWCGTNNNNNTNSINTNNTAGILNRRPLNNTVKLDSAGATSTTMLMMSRNTPVENIPPHPATAPPTFGVDWGVTSSTSPRSTHMSLAPLNHMPIGNGWMDCSTGATSSSNLANHPLVNSDVANPYAPDHRSTGDAAADKQLAALYKARDALRQQFQS